VAIIKRILCFFYAIHALGFGLITIALLLSGPRLARLHANHSPVVNAAYACAYVLLAVCFAMAWYTVRKGLPSARYWVIVPSLLFLAGAVVGVFFFHHDRMGYLPPVFVLSLGLTGPIVTWRKQSRTVATGTAPIPKVKGDGTSSLLNQAGALFSIASYIGSLTLWNRWLESHGLPVAHRGLIEVIVVSLVATFFHELGHASIGIAFHMKLRAFVVGPFSWRIDEGRWKFKFNAAGFLSMGGATGVVPSSATQPAWHELAMITAGPATNLYWGILSGAFAVAFAQRPDAYGAYISPLALFAIINFVDCFTNLIPIRTATGYSDGAQIYQILSGGAWAAYHRSISVVTASLVTPLRPRNYDMEALERASQGISEGLAGLRLRLFKYSHYLDCGRLQESRQAIEEAEAIYNLSAIKLPAELHTGFVFANAYVRRDATAARSWWTRMEAKNPTRFNVDYWRASSALHWIEGNLAQANEDWSKCNEKAQRLPAAGAYEFDRYLCGLLRRVIDGDTRPPEIVEAARLVQKPAPAATLNGVVVKAPRVGTLEEPGYQWLYLQPRSGEMQSRSREV